MANLKYFLSIVILIYVSLASPIVLAEREAIKDPKIIWSCKKRYGNENILWLVEWGSKSYIKVFDERIPTKYSMNGLEKRWDWGLDSSDYTYDYAITLGPDRTAVYYDFMVSKGDIAKPREIYKCTK